MLAKVHQRKRWEASYDSRGSVRALWSLSGGERRQNSETRRVAGQIGVAIGLNTDVCHRPAITLATFPTRFSLVFLVSYSLKKGFGLVHFARKERRTPAVGVVSQHKAAMRILELVRREGLAEELATEREAEKGGKTEKIVGAARTTRQRRGEY